MLQAVFSLIGVWGIVDGLFLLLNPSRWAETWTRVLQGIARRPLLVWSTALLEAAPSLVVAFASVRRPR